MIEVREYLDRSGRSPYADWFDRLASEAAAKVAVALVRVQQGNFSSVKGVGSGVYEYRIDFGPGFRIYFGKDGDQLVSSSAVEPKSASNVTSNWQCLVGTITKREKPQEALNAFNQRFQRNNPRARPTRSPFPPSPASRRPRQFSLWRCRTGKLVLRDFINATVGFAKLGRATDRSAKSLNAQLGADRQPASQKPRGNCVVSAERAEGVRFEVRPRRTSIGTKQPEGR